MTAAPSRVEISAIAAGGDGVGRIDRMVVFVPRTAPGDVADVALAPGKKFARGTLVGLISESPLRRRPPCIHYEADRCGGCQLQHLQYPAQLSAKATIIADSLRRIGRRDTDAVHVEPSESEWRYRRKLTLHLRRAGGKWIAGLHPHDDPAFVFDLVECPITDDRVLAVWRALRPAFDRLPRESSLRVAVRLIDGGAAVIVEGGSRWTSSSEFFMAVPAIVELWWKPEHGRARLLESRLPEMMAGAAFIQVNATVAARLRAHVLDAVRAHAPRQVVDAYAGSGDTTLPLVAGGIVVTAIELDAEAVARFADRLAAPSRAIVGRVEDHLGPSLPADVVILNPPRSGVDARVTDALERSTQPPRAIVYVSCDPATLARDMARLPGFRLAAVRAYDMFPQTAHVETVCELVPEAA